AGPVRGLLGGTCSPAAFLAVGQGNRLRIKETAAGEKPYTSHQKITPAGCSPDPMAGGGGMDQTRQSLLLRAQAGEENAWKDLTELYRPLILGWLNRQGMPAGDLEDLSQDILLSVVKHLPSFQHSGRRGAFRSWLRTIVCSRTTDYWRAFDAVTQASGG